MAILLLFLLNTFVVINSFAQEVPLVYEVEQTGSESILQIPFTVGRNEAYYIFARLNCPSADDDSFWVRIDDGEFEMLQ